MLDREASSLVTQEKARVDRVVRDSLQKVIRQRKPATDATENSSELLEHKLVSLEIKR